VIRAAGGRAVALKVHQCNWSGRQPANSLPAILECYRARVARAEIDVAMLRDDDFLVVHDLDLAEATDGSGRVEETTRAAASRLRLRQGGTVTAERPPLLSEVVAAIAAEPFPTLLELDLKDWRPWPWPRVEALAASVQPVKDRVTLGGGADWNLRRLHRVDPTLPLGFDPMAYLDWVPPGETIEPLPGVRGAYGYLDAHPLARARCGPTADYLRDRLGGILRLVPGAREVHLRLLAVERMRADGLVDLAELLHGRGMLLDVWTLDADTPDWERRLAGALALGADVVTTNTPRALARAADRVLDRPGGSPGCRGGA
jgi:glycerophosphoryl diester phosphodiesterase